MWSKKGKKIIAAAIAIIMVLAMIVPMAMDMFM
jgi:hypothetical protein